MINLIDKLDNDGISTVPIARLQEEFKEALETNRKFDYKVLKEASQSLSIEKNSLITMIPRDISIKEGNLSLTGKVEGLQVGKIDPQKAASAMSRLNNGLASIYKNGMATTRGEAKKNYKEHIQPQNER